MTPLCPVTFLHNSAFSRAVSANENFVYDQLMSENALQFIRCIMLFLSGVLAFASAARAADPLFQSADTLWVEISAPLSTLVRERPEEEELPGTFSYTAEDGTRVELDIQVRARGNFRYKFCDFPPLNLNFRRSQLEGTLLQNQNKLKLVGHCKITRRYEQSVLREYLAYRAQLMGMARGEAPAAIARTTRGPRPMRSAAQPPQTQPSPPAAMAPKASRSAVAPPAGPPEAARLAAR